MDRPFGLLAELTYRCPLSCAYCSNPVDMASYGDELTTAEWRRNSRSLIDRVFHVINKDVGVACWQD